jgi:Zc3h12a-like Ribonuclease NYN domain
VPLAEPHHVVVDGSNLATEGRTSPSLAQLNESVRAYAAEDPGATMIVVVDATFEHRVSEKERDKVRKAMLDGVIVSPPAGAIGRGDAFVLRIAERTGAIVLSNDSFQEFHGEHPWLFDEDRLIGGKPIAGVGWIFTPRVPIRGAKSRAATAEAKAAKDPESAPAKAAELARAAKKAAKEAAKATKKAQKKVAPVATSWPIEPAVPPPGRAKVDPVFSSALEDAVEEALHPDARNAKPAKKRAAKKQAAKKQAPKKQAAAKKAAAEKSAKAKKDAGGKHGQRETDGRVEQPSRPGRARSKKKRASPPPAVNEPLAFINFVAAYNVGSTIEGEVVSFTSHGAMVDVSFPGGGVLHCYIPLTAMGDPPPTKARQVLKKSEVRPFVLAGLDPPRRVAELAIPRPETPSRGRPGKKQPFVKKAAPAKKAAGRPEKAPAKKAPAAKKRPVKKQPAKRRAAAKKGGPPSKKGAPVKQPAARKQPSEKPSKQQPTKKRPAKKATANVAKARH